MQKLFFLIMVMLINHLAKSQNYIGYSQNNYSGVHAGYTNPAFMADNRLLVDVNLLSGSARAFNDYLYFSPRNMPFGYIKTYVGKDKTYANDSLNNRVVPFGQVENYRNNLMTGNLFEFENSENNLRSFLYNHEVAILNVMVSLDQDIAFSFGIKQRSFINLDEVSYDLMSLGRTSLKDSFYWNLPQEQQNINISFNTWNEYTLGLASVIYNKNAHFVKTGLNLKYLQGISAAFISSDNISYQILNADTASYISGEINYAYSDNLSNSSFFNDSLSFSSFGINLLNPLSGAGGNGFGADLGFVYEWRPKYKDFQYEMDGKTGIERPDLNKYRLRVALALNDLGGIRYTRANDSRRFKFADGLTNFDLSQLRPQNLADFSKKIDELQSQDKLSYIGKESTFFMTMPTHVNASVDFLVVKNFYLNGSALLNTPFTNNGSRSMYESNYSFTPRYEHPYFSLAIPVSYSKRYKTRVGLSARLSPYLVVGTSNLLPFFSAGKDVEVIGADLYFALKVPILKRTARDTDGDLVSDKEDLCIKTPGVWQFRGCPDTDNDGVQDADDRCPEEAGEIEFSGCPDTDGDKIIDSKDDCPNVAGLPEFNGCPDTDGDKIIDGKDQCPTEAGVIEFNGCPDTDGDGIKNADDLCPENAGPKENNGCPDTDKDGLFDYLDDCPTIAGPKENKGCPWPDTDNDGILDKDDKCPLNSGPRANFGCPYIDTDGDGVFDKDDNCVNVPGSITNMGCPEIEKEEQEIIRTAFENLEFETAKAIIKPSSFESLDKLAELLAKKPEWRLKISGHTDSQGGEQNNLILSKKRAVAVSKYLATKGIKVSERIVIAYFGEEKPIADNNTPEGRQANRRVEMDIIFE